MTRRFVFLDQNTEVEVREGSALIAYGHLTGDTMAFSDDADGQEWEVTFIDPQMRNVSWDEWFVVGDTGDLEQVINDYLTRGVEVTR